MTKKAAVSWIVGLLTLGGALIGVNAIQSCSAQIATAPIEIITGAQLSAWIQSVPDGCGPGSTTVSPYNVLKLQPNANYLLDTPLVLSLRHWLRFEGNGATLDGTRQAPGKRQLLLKRGDHLVFKNLKIVGNHPIPGTFVSAYQWGHNIHIEGSTFVLVDGITGLNAYGDGLIVQACGPHDGCNPTDLQPSDITVQNSTFAGNGRMSLAIVTGDRITFQDNVLGPTGYSIFDIEPEYASLTTNDIKILRNRTRNVWLVWLPMGGLCNRGMKNIVVADNVMEISGRATNLSRIEVKTPFGCARRGPFTIVRNTLIDLYGQFGLRFRGAQDVTIEGNVVSWAKIQFPIVYGVRLENSIGVQILNNRFVRAHQVVLPISSDYVESGNKFI
jgi:hypothetical protein